MFMVCITDHLPLSINSRCYTEPVFLFSGVGDWVLVISLEAACGQAAFPPWSSQQPPAQHAHLGSPIDMEDGWTQRTSGFPTSPFSAAKKEEPWEAILSSPLRNRGKREGTGLLHTPPGSSGPVETTRRPALGHQEQEPIAKAGPRLLQHLPCLPAKVYSPWLFPLPSCLPQEGRQEPGRSDLPHWRAEETKTRDYPAWLLGPHCSAPAEVLNWVPVPAL